MKRRTTLLVAFGGFAVLCLAGRGIFAEDKAAKAEQKVPEIQGITVADPLPNGCVGCHKNYPEKNMDVRLTKILAKWKDGVEPKYLKLAQAGMSAGVTLTGKHPDVGALVKVIPDDCLMCHRGGSEKVPEFEVLLHAIHLTGGADNHYIMNFGGQCMNCHKLDAKTGKWHLGSGREAE